MAKEKEVKAPMQTPEEVAAAAKCYEWFEEYDKPAHKEFETEMDEYDKLRDNDHWDLLGPTGSPLRTSAQKVNRPNAIENITMSFIEGMISEFSRSVDIVDFPVEKSDNEVATVMTDLKKHIADKNSIPEERMKFASNYFWNSVGIWETIFDPTWKGGRGPNRWEGDIRWRSVHPRAFFPDARCGDNIHNGRRVHTVSRVSREYIEETYPKYGKLAQDTTGGMNLGNHSDNESYLKGAVDIVTTWYIGEPLIPDEEGRTGKGLHAVFWAGEGQAVYLDHANYVHFDPGEDPELPFDVRVRYYRNGKWYGWSDAHYLKPVQIMHNKTVETLHEGHMHAAIGQGFFEEGALSEKQRQELQKKGTLHGMWFGVNDINKVKKVHGQSMPASLLQEAERAPQMAERITGRFDVTQGAAPGSVVAFSALNLLSQNANKRLIKVDIDFTRSYEKCGKYINRLIWRNYTEQRAYRVIGVKDDKLVMEKEGVFERDKYRKVFVKSTREVLPLGEFQPLKGMEEGVHYEVYDPDLDVRCKTSQAMPSDRLFFMEVAKELMVAGMINDKIFFYVLEHGRFPPWSEVGVQVEAWRQQQMMAQMGGQVPPTKDIPGNVMRQALPQNVKDAIDAMTPGEAKGLADKIEALPPEAQAEMVALLGQG